METARAQCAMFFSFVELVKGNHYVAGVAAKGQALMVHEDDGSWWMYGVKPGGMAASGSTFKEATHSFNTSFKAILLDIAESCSAYDEFSREVRRMFEQVDTEDETRWLSAREALRTGEAVLGPDTADLPRVTEPDPTGLEVERLDDSSVRPNNMLDAFQAAA